VVLQETGALPHRPRDSIWLPPPLTVRPFAVKLTNKPAPLAAFDSPCFPYLALYSDSCAACSVSLGLGRKLCHKPS
jgi:hypothetical protein